MAERDNMAKKENTFKVGKYKYEILKDVQKDKFNLMRGDEPLVLLCGAESTALGNPTMRFEPQQVISSFSKFEDRIAIEDACRLLESRYLSQHENP